jgi:hypothetical protein
MLQPFICDLEALSYLLALALQNEKNARYLALL